MLSLALLSDHPSSSEPEPKGTLNDARGVAGIMQGGP